MKSPQAGTDRLTRPMLWVAGAALALMMLIVVGDVALRAAFNTPVAGAYDLVEYCLLAMVFFGIAPVVARRGEILIDILDALLPPRLLAALNLVASVGTLALFAFLGWALVQPAEDAWMWGGNSLELGWPEWTQYAVAFTGLAGIVAASALRVVRSLRGASGPGAGGSAAETEEGAL